MSFVKYEGAETRCTTWSIHDNGTITSPTGFTPDYDRCDVWIDHDNKYIALHINKDGKAKICNMVGTSTKKIYMIGILSTLGIDRKKIKLTKLTPWHQNIDGKSMIVFNLQEVGK